MSKNANVALITGSAGSAGSKIVERLKKEGYFTVGIDLVSGTADMNIICDVRNREAMIEAAAKIEKEAGAISVLVICAGATVDGRYEDVSMQEWQTLLDVWLKGTLNACAAVAPYMVERKNGRIVSLSADYENTDSGYILDAAASSSVHGFIKSFACEMAPYNVIANVLFASVPFDLEAIASTVAFLANEDSFIVGQALTIHGLN